MYEYISTNAKTRKGLFSLVELVRVERAEFAYGCRLKVGGREKDGWSERELRTHTRIRRLSREEAKLSRPDAMRDERILRSLTGG